jgi:hypothetical protein
VRYPGLRIGGAFMLPQRNGTMQQGVR